MKQRYYSNGIAVELNYKGKKYKKFVKNHFELNLFLIEIERYNK
ncbi:hypothetical protein [Fusobacterium sp. FSA-380-WT-2B]|nr:hypothetical protein [Fusobacterium sp. FSA-380-WT-2B]